MKSWVERGGQVVRKDGKEAMPGEGGSAAGGPALPSPPSALLDRLWTCSVGTVPRTLLGFCKSCC